MTKICTLLDSTSVLRTLPVMSVLLSYHIKKKKHIKKRIIIFIRKQNNGK